LTCPFLFQQVAVGRYDNTTLYLIHPRLCRGWVNILKPNRKDTPSPGLWTFVRVQRRCGHPIGSNKPTSRKHAYRGQLDTRQYAEHELPFSPLLAPGINPPDWYAGGMHQFGPWWAGDYWLVAYDGKDTNGVYSIGLKIALEPKP
jgi:hypothetical protein